MISVAICGAMGRMGGEVSRLVCEQKDMAFTAAIELAGHPHIGMRLGEVDVVSDLSGCIDGVGVVVDFTNPAGAAHHASLCAKHGVPLVVGVTALKQDQMETIKKAADRIAIVYAPNMSVGVNLLFRLVAETAGILDKDYDVEIIEMHHRMKKDAPSGTAAKIAEIVRQVRGKGQDVHGRRGMVGERKPEEIGLHALRGGDVVGEHTVIFAGQGERLELTHKASSRRTFAAGVIRAIRFVASQKPGLYDMKDVLGIS